MHVLLVTQQITAKKKVVFSSLRNEMYIHIIYIYIGKFRYWKIFKVFL